MRSPGKIQAWIQRFGPEGGPRSLNTKSDPVHSWKIGLNPESETVTMNFPWRPGSTELFSGSLQTSTLSYTLPQTHIYRFVQNTKIVPFTQKELDNSQRDLRLDDACFSFHNYAEFLFQSMQEKSIRNKPCPQHFAAVLYPADNNLHLVQTLQKDSAEDFKTLSFELGRGGSKILVPFISPSLETSSSSVFFTQGDWVVQVGPALSEHASVEISIYPRYSKNHISIPAVVFCTCAKFKSYLNQKDFHSEADCLFVYNKLNWLTNSKNRQDEDSTWTESTEWNGSQGTQCWAQRSCSAEPLTPNN